MRENEILDKLMKSPRIKNLGLTEDAVNDILKTYDTIAIEGLLSEGHIELGNGMIIEVVQLLDRVHVLRGTSYNSSRKYKLKLTMEDYLYTRIEDYYDKLREEIG